MITERLKRLGVILSVVWPTFGGYYLYIQSSNPEYWDNVNSICAMEPGELCNRAKAEGYQLFPTDWTLVGFPVLLGLLAIWGALLALAWVQRGR